MRCAAILLRLQALLDQFEHYSKPNKWNEDWPLSHLFRAVTSTCSWLHQLPTAYQITYPLIGFGKDEGQKQE
jgi:hypothetical protein